MAALEKVKHLEADGHMQVLATRDKRGTPWYQVKATSAKGDAWLLFGEIQVEAICKSNDVQTVFLDSPSARLFCLEEPDKHRLFKPLRQCLTRRSR